MWHSIGLVALSSLYCKWAQTAKQTYFNLKFYLLLFCFYCYVLPSINKITYYFNIINIIIIIIIIIIIMCIVDLWWDINIITDVVHCKFNIQVLGDPCWWCHGLYCRS